MEQCFNELEKTIEEEIVLYKELEKLYEDKQVVIVNKKPEQLVEIDSKIISKFTGIKPLINKRNNLFTSNFQSEISMSAIIEKCQEVNPERAKRLQEMKEEINALSKRLRQLETTNKELTKFGIKLTNKTLQIILNNINISSKEYDKKGKINTQEQLQLSSVVEEA